MMDISVLMKAAKDLTKRLKIDRINHILKYFCRKAYANLAETGKSTMSLAINENQKWVSMAFLHTEHLSKACKEKSCKLNGGSAQNKCLKREIIEEINVKGG